MLNKYLFFLLFLFVTCSCAQPSQEMLFKRERDERIYSALSKFKTAMEAKGYRVAGIGEGLDHSTGKQNYLGATFDIEKLPDVNFAREVEVEALQEFLSYINAEEGIQDYVAEYPYPLKFTYIAFISKDRENGLFSVANNSQEEIYYLKDDPKMSFGGPAKEVHRETYKEAVRILGQEDALEQKGDR
jgi:hypothetical protein